MSGVTSFAVDLDTRQLYHVCEDSPRDAKAQLEAQKIGARLDDDVLDAIARVWHLAKGQLVPPVPGEGGAKLQVEEWRPGDLVIWDEVQPALRGDTYVFGERRFEALELYCVEPDCACGEVVIDFDVTFPRGAPYPGHVEFDGREPTVRPAHERHRGRIEELWGAYCTRHPDYRERFVRRSAAMHRLAGRIVAAPPKPKVGRNGSCPCGSGKKHKKCCGAA